MLVGISCWILTGVYPDAKPAPTKVGVGVRMTGEGKGGAEEDFGRGATSFTRTYHIHARYIVLPVKGGAEEDLGGAIRPYPRLL